MSTNTDRLVALHSALERITDSYRLLLARKPVRDVEETLAEADAALSQPQASTPTAPPAEVSEDLREDIAPIDSGIKRRLYTQAQMDAALSTAPTRCDCGAECQDRRDGCRYVDVPAMPEPGYPPLPPFLTSYYDDIDQEEVRCYSAGQMQNYVDADRAARLAANSLALAEAKELADSEGSRAVQYLRRARKAEAELAAQAAPTEPSDAERDALADLVNQIRKTSPVDDHGHDFHQNIAYIKAVQLLNGKDRK